MTQKKLVFQNLVAKYLGEDIEEHKHFRAPSEFKDKPFYCWDTEYLGNRDCCFNHMIGLPVDSKTHEVKPLFPYEKEIFNIWEQYMYIWIKKATGLGVSEFFLRLMLWLCLKDDTYQGCQMCIVVGPNIDLAKKLIRRMRDMIIDYPSFEFDTKTEYILEVNRCWIQAYPSHNLASFRSLDKPKFIFIDIADFFPLSQIVEVRHVSERYIAKSSPWIVMVSTPNAPGGLFEQIEEEPESTCLFKRLQYNYKHGEGLIYSKEDIAAAKKSLSFEREYNLKYAGMIGNVWPPEMIQACMELGDEIPKEDPNWNADYAVGVDFGFNVSKSVICVGQWYNDRQVLRIVEMEDFGSRPTTPSRVAEEIWNIYQKYGPNTNFFVDGSNRGAVNEIKVKFGETLQWDKYFKKEVHKSERIHPINFNQHHESMLEQMYMMTAEGVLAIPSQYDKLIVAMRTAQATDFDLDKEATVNDDYLDAARLMCYVIRYNRK